MAEKVEQPDLSTRDGSRGLAIRKRAKEIDLAIKLDGRYEFKYTEDGKKLLMLDAKPLLPHSWTKVPAAPAENKRFYLTADGSSKFALDLPHGVTAVLGKSGSGKTRFVFDHLFYSTVARGEKAVYIRAFEPGDVAKLREYTTDATFFEASFELDLVQRVVDALIDPAVDVIIIDSLRYLFYSSSGGATGKGGVNMGIFMDLTHLDLVAAAFQKRIIVVVNPMTDDENAFNFYIEASVGAVSGVVVMSDYRNARISNRLDASRDFKPFSIPQYAATDKRRIAQQDRRTPAIGHTRGADPSVSASIFGLNSRK